MSVSTGRISCLILFAVISIIVSPQAVFSGQAATIDELVSMYDIKKCVECHEDKYEEWKTSSMGNSVSDPRVLKGMRTFIRLALDKEQGLGRKDLKICLDCHVPQIKNAAPELILHIGDLILTAVEDEDVSRRESATKDLSKLNINCFVCHNMKSLGFGKQTQEGVIYGPEDVGNPHEEIGFRTIKSEFMTTSGLCAQCHHCPPDVAWKECPTIYTSYIEDFISKGHKETCQDCHMDGDRRSHKFYGPNDLDFLKSSITLAVNARPTKYVDIYTNDKLRAVALEVKLTNHAGHEIPHG
ncbi:MAG: hypothetical protein HY758_02055 [Nitrospirae bacterium]|nr:hypothetical protein [Nitrospirota bacterium]